MGGPYMPRVIPTSVVRIARMIALAFIAQAMVGPLDAQDAPDAVSYTHLTLPTNREV